MTTLAVITLFVIGMLALVGLYAVSREVRLSPREIAVYSAIGVAALAFGGAGWWAVWVLAS